MSTVYTPNASNNPTSYTVPSDGDNANAASILVGLEAVMDKASYLAAATANSVASYKLTFVAVTNTVVTSALTTSGVTVATATFPSTFNLLSTDLIVVQAVASMSSSAGAVNVFFKGGFAYSGGTSYVDSSYSQGANSSTTGFVGQNVPYLYAGTSLALTTVASFSLGMAAGAVTYSPGVNQVRLVAAILRAG